MISRGRGFYTRYTCCLVICSLLLHSIPATAAAHVSTLDQLRQAYPDAVIHHVAAEDYPELAAQLYERGYQPSSSLPLSMASNAEAGAASAGGLSPEQSDQRDCADRQEHGEDSVGLALDVSADMLDAGSSSDEAAAVVFIVVGAVVLVVWTLYVVRYFLDVAMGREYCNTWREFSAIRRSGNSAGETLRFNGLSYVTGFREGNTGIGVGLELGRSEIRVGNVSPLQLEGGYWLMGPVVRWSLPLFSERDTLGLNFYAGSTENDEVGLLAKAGINMMFGVSQSIRLGLSWDILRLDVDEDQGLVTDENRFQTMYGVRLGIRF